MQLPEHFFSDRRLETLVENQTSYTLDQAALHVFETHQTAERVLLTFDQPVLASMLQGKKVMHLHDRASFDFLPGESLILPARATMCIDFPEAQPDRPTRCLAMAISEEKVRQTVELMNETMPRLDGEVWQATDYSFRFTHDPGIHQILQRLLFLFTEDHPSKELFVNNMLQELMIRILRTDVREKHLSATTQAKRSTRLGEAVTYIRTHLNQSIRVDTLSEKACMSPSHFYRVFKSEMGISPVDYINEERIRLATSLLQDPQRKIKEVYMECGFESRSYFNRLFKRKNRLSPSQYQDQFS